MYIKDLKRMKGFHKIYKTGSKNLLQIIGIISCVYLFLYILTCFEFKYFNNLNTTISRISFFKTVRYYILIRIHNLKKQLFRSHPLSAVVIFSSVLGFGVAAQDENSSCCTNEVDMTWNSGRVMPVVTLMLCRSK